MDKRIGNENTFMSLRITSNAPYAKESAEDTTPNWAAAVEVILIGPERMEETWK